MGEISGKLLGLVATVAIFIVVIMLAVYPKIDAQGEGVGTKIQAQTDSLNILNSGDWNNP